MEGVSIKNDAPDVGHREGSPLVRRRLWQGLLLALVGLVAACNGDSSASSATPVSGSTSPAVTLESDEETYRTLVTLVVNDVGQVTRLLNSVGVQLAAAPEQAAQAQSIVSPAKGSFDLARAQMEEIRPPDGYAEVHERLLEALDLYGQAAAALLPDSKTQAADFWLFQELMQQGGKNFHLATAALDDVRS